MSDQSETNRLIYLEAFSDEVMPCAPTLEAWANWLSKADAEFGRTSPADDGAEYVASTLILLGDRRADYADGRWSWAEPPPTDADQFFLRPFEGAQGWDSDYAANDLENAADGLEDWYESPVWFACTKDGGDIVVRYLAPQGDQPARCEIVGTPQ